MTSKAIITRRDTARSQAALLDESASAKNLGLKVEHSLPHGTLVSGDEKQIANLEGLGYRVKKLRKPTIIEVGAYEIDTKAAAPKVPARLEVPKSLEGKWSHHLVQLIGPPQPAWIRTIEENNIEVVEPLSRYALFVAGDPKEVGSLTNLPFVDWVGPFKPAYRVGRKLLEMRGNIKYVNIGVYPEKAVDEVREALEKAGAKILSESSQETSYGEAFGVLLTELNAAKLTEIASLAPVRWIEYQGVDVLLDERSSQIVAENFDDAAPPNTAPVTGYRDSLAELELSGAGVTIGIVDSGIDTHDNATMHPDLAGRMDFFVEASEGETTVDASGHGTHVAGIAVGNATSGDMDPERFLLGLGIAPGSRFGSVNAIGTRGPDRPGMPDDDRVLSVANNNGQVMNNSWGEIAAAGVGYTARSRNYDQRVRDPNSDAAGLERLAIVSAAGNDGGADTTIAAPWEAKNPIVVGNSLNFRPGEFFPSDDIRGIGGTSSRGPAADGRFLPIIVAPGTDIISTRPGSTVDGDPSVAGIQRPRTAYTDTSGTVHQNYFRNSGTSMAAPHVSGLCALLTEWWRNRTGGRNLSPALLKALLINGAEDLAGGDNWRSLNTTAADKATWSLESGSVFQRPLAFIPAALVEGNRVLTQVATLANLTAAGRWFFDAASNALFVRMVDSTNPGDADVRRLECRDEQPLAHVPNNHQGWGRVSLDNIVRQGPKIFSDQRLAFTASGQEHVIRVAPDDPERPLRITLVWTDAPGPVGEGRALVNDLDLEVTDDTGNIFLGNIFENGFSVTGGDPDDINNVECVYIERPVGTFDIRIIATDIRASARPDLATPWQDFALVIDNAQAPSAEPVSVVPVIDRSSSMVGFGYVDITKISSQQFVDLMGIDDQLGVVSFGSTSTVEFPTGPAPTLRTIDGSDVKDAAKDEIDEIRFAGCTFMGAGINEAKGLLEPVTGARAMVLLSDGYDNKGCDPTNPDRPSAREAAMGLPPNMPVHTCAMGPASDQALLEQIAEDSGGRFYYMPTIDDLFEVYNFIRGHVTGDAIVVNESAMASSSRVAGFVDALASEATFSVAWADTKRRFVAGDPKKADEVSVRLRDPRGRLLHPSDSYVRRIVGKGYVIFKLQEPMPGQWYVEVSTVNETHLRYTVGGFVRSQLKLAVSLRASRVTTNSPLNIGVQMFDGKLAFSGFKGRTQVVRPTVSIPGLLVKYKNELRNIQPARLPGGDTLPGDIAKLSALRTRLLQQQKEDLFAHRVGGLKLRSSTIGDLQRLRFDHLAIPFVTGANQLTGESPFADGLMTNSALTAPAFASPATSLLVGQFGDTREQGSYNLMVSVNGVSPVSRTRFVRKDMVSVLVS